MMDTLNRISIMNIIYAYIYSLYIIYFAGALQAHCFSVPINLVLSCNIMLYFIFDPILWRVPIVHNLVSILVNHQRKATKEKRNKRTNFTSLFRK